MHIYKWSNFELLVEDLACLVVFYQHFPSVVVSIILYTVIAYLIMPCYHSNSNHGSTFYGDLSHFGIYHGNNIFFLWQQGNVHVRAANSSKNILHIEFDDWHCRTVHTGGVESRRYYMAHCATTCKWREKRCPPSFPNTNLQWNQLKLLSNIPQPMKEFILFWHLELEDFVLGN